MTSRNTLHFLNQSETNNLLLIYIAASLSTGPYIDVAAILDVAALPRELIQVNGVNFIKLLLQSAVS